MTDQPEPKYKIGDWVMITDEVRPLKICNIMKEYGNGRLVYSFDDYGPVHDETNILHAVVIHPIEHHKCKDCEHTMIIPNIGLQCYDYNYCPRAYLANDLIAHCNEHTEPPPNCYCFTPKLSPDEKESNGKDM